MPPQDNISVPIAEQLNAPATDSKSDKESLLKEYETNLQLWIHADNLRQKRMQNFLTINAGLLAVLGTLLSLRPHVNVLVGVSIAYSIFGILVCRVWARALSRNAEYTKIHRYQLRYIEQQLPGVSTFSNIWRGLYDHKPVDFGEAVGTFLIREGKIRKSSAVTEAQIPVLVLLFWIAVAMASIVALFFPWLVTLGN